MATYETVSRHFLRRTARAKERRLEDARRAGRSSGKDHFHYRVEKEVRGPFRYRVVRVDLGR